MRQACTVLLPVFSFCICPKINVTADLDSCFIYAELPKDFMATPQAHIPARKDTNIGPVRFCCVFVAILSRCIV